MNNYQFNTVKAWLEGIITSGQSTIHECDLQTKLGRGTAFVERACRIDRMLDVVQQLLMGLHGEFLSKGGDPTEAEAELTIEDWLERDSIHQLRQSHWLPDKDAMEPETYEFQIQKARQPTCRFIS